MSGHSPLSRAMRDAWIDLFPLAAGIAGSNAPVSQESVTQVRAHAWQTLELGRRKLLELGMPEQQLRDLQLPVIALLDEVAQRRAGFRNYWPPLQFEIHQTARIGRVVFERLNALRHDPATPVEMLEMYARCIVWGLQGEYYPDRLEQLAGIAQSLQGEIERRLSQAPLIAPIEAGRAHGRRNEVLGPIWVAVVAAVLLITTWAAVTLRFSFVSREIGRTVQMSAGALRAVADNKAKGTP